MVIKYQLLVFASLSLLTAVEYISYDQLHHQILQPRRECAIVFQCILFRSYWKNHKNL